MLTGAPMAAGALTAHVLRILAADDPVRPDPGEARRWAEEELAKPGYGKSYLERFADWVGQRLADLFGPTPTPGSASVPTPFAIAAVAIIAAVVLALVVQGRRRRTPAPEEDRPADDVFGERPRSAADYRRSSRQAADAGDHSLAVVDGFRAIAAEMIERHLLDDARDRTARGFGAAVGSAFPAYRDGGRAAAIAFEAALYGGLPVAPGTAADMLALDAALLTATPRPVDAGELPTPLGVPR